MTFMRIGMPIFLFSSRKAELPAGTPGGSAGFQVGLPGGAGSR